MNHFFVFITNVSCPTGSTLKADYTLSQPGSASVAGQVVVFGGVGNTPMDQINALVLRDARDLILATWSVTVGPTDMISLLNPVADRRG